MVEHSISNVLAIGGQGTVVWCGVGGLLVPSCSKPILKHFITRLFYYSFI